MVQEQLEWLVNKAKDLEIDKDEFSEPRFFLAKARYIPNMILEVMLAQEGKRSLILADSLFSELHLRMIGRGYFDLIKTKEEHFSAKAIFAFLEYFAAENPAIEDLEKKRTIRYLYSAARATKSDLRYYLTMKNLEPLKKAFFVGKINEEKIMQIAREHIDEMIVDKRTKELCEYFAQAYDLERLLKRDEDKFSRREWLRTKLCGAISFENEYFAIVKEELEREYKKIFGVTITGEEKDFLMELVVRLDTGLLFDYNSDDESGEELARLKGMRGIYEIIFEGARLYDQYSMMNALQYARMTSRTPEQYDKILENIKGYELLIARLCCSKDVANTVENRMKEE